MYQSITDFNNPFSLLSSVEVGEHFYWRIANFQFHGQVFLVSWFVFFVLVLISLLGTRNISLAPTGVQNFLEYVLEFIQDIAQSQKTESEVVFE